MELQKGAIGLTSIDLQPREMLADMVRAIEEDGYLYCPNVLDADEVEELRSRIDALPANLEANDVDMDGTLGNQAPGSNKHIKVLFNRDAYFLQYLDK